jgi:hypothetical protein
MVKIISKNFTIPNTSSITPIYFKLILNITAAHNNSLFRKQVVRSI